MDSFTTQKAKSRNRKKLAKKCRTHIIVDLFFQAIEIIVVLVTVAKLCHQLVVTFGDTSVASLILANRNLAFVIGNAIVIALIAKSGFLLNQELEPKCKSNYFYEEFVRERSERDGISRTQIRNREKQSEAENEATQSISENISKQSNSDQMKKTEKKTKQRISAKRDKLSKPEKCTNQNLSLVEHHEMEKQNLIEKRQSQSYQRSRSENLKGSEKSYCGRLRRSETDASCERFDSDDELRYKIESFIARQRRKQLDD